MTDMSQDPTLTDIDAALIAGCTLRVAPEWIDANGHMNVAYYVQAFDQATDYFLERINLGWSYLERDNGSTFTAEMNVSHISEVHLDAPLAFTTQLIGFDDKRVHYFHQMFHAEEGFLAATNECLSLHVDMASRKVAPIPSAQVALLKEIQESQAHLPAPSRLGRVMKTKQK